MRILLLEDDYVLSREIRMFLEQKQHEVHVVFDGALFFEELVKHEYDALLLDINVPHLNGLEICRRVRLNNGQVPIIMLTAYGDISDKKHAFSLGADDYLVKPFLLEELELRLQSVSRRLRLKDNPDKIIQIADLSINATEATVTRANKSIELTPKEYQVLLILANAKGRTLSKQFIAEQIWDVNFDSNYNTIEVYINFLRKKIDKEFHPKLIHTRTGFGYFLKDLGNDA
jgi:DNA-binding response OmpR family regulator